MQASTVVGAFLWIILGRGSKYRKYKSRPPNTWMKKRQILEWKYAKYLNEKASNTWMKIRQILEWKHAKYLNENLPNTWMKNGQILE